MTKIIKAKLAKITEEKLVKFLIGISCTYCFGVGTACILWNIWFPPMLAGITYMFFGITLSFFWSQYKRY